jgi:integrase
MGVYRRGENWYVDFNFLKKRYRRRIGPSRKGAEKVISKMKAEIAENKFLDIWKRPDPIKFKDFVDKYYLKNVEAERRKRSRLDILKREFGEKIVQEITPFQVERYKMSRKESLKPATVNRELALIKHVFSKAVEYGMLKENPAKKVKLLKGEAVRVRFLSPEETGKLIENCDETIKPLVIVSLNTGFRKSELIGLTWDRVDMERGILTLIKTKAGKRRDVRTCPQPPKPRR